MCHKQEREQFLFVVKIKDNASFTNCKNPVTVREAIGDLAYLNSGEGSFEAPYVTTAGSDYQKFMRANSTKLFNHKASNHNKIAIKN